MIGSEPARTLVGGVGYHDLCDFSVGPLLAARLMEETWPDTVTVEDLSYGPVAVLHRLGDEAPPFDRIVLIGAVRRGRDPGAIAAYRWDGDLPDTEAIQARVAEAVTAVVGVENLVIVVAALGGAPEEVYVVEIEPWVEAMGDDLSPPVERAAEEARRVAREIALAPPGATPVTVAPLGGAVEAAGGRTGRSS